MVAVEMAVVSVEGREDVVAVETDIIDVGRHELDDSGQCLAVVPDGAVAYLPLRFVVVDVVETQLVIRL